MINATGYQVCCENCSTPLSPTFVRKVDAEIWEKENPAAVRSEALLHRLNCRSCVEHRIDALRSIWADGGSDQTKPTIVPASADKINNS